MVAIFLLSFLFMVPHIFWRNFRSVFIRSAELLKIDEIIPLLWSLTFVLRGGESSSHCRKYAPQKIWLCISLIKTKSNFLGESEAFFHENRIYFAHMTSLQIYEKIAHGDDEARQEV